MGLFGTRPATLPTAEQALPGRAARMELPSRHFVLGTPLAPPFPQGLETTVLGLGCFWGAERKYWQTTGVYSTAVGYCGGQTPNPTYHEVCSGRTGHAEVVQVVFDPRVVAFEELLRIFWEAHDPTQGMRQGNDVGTQYRSALYCQGAAQLSAALASAEVYGKLLARAGHGRVTTEIRPALELYFAEAYHQQYLAKNPDGYCGLGGTGVACPTGLGTLRPEGGVGGDGG